MEIIEAPSPNFDERPVGVGVDILLLHYTGMKTGPDALARLRERAAGVSAHYLVEEDGRVFRLVAEEKRAWHAGVASWAGASDINARSVGVEIVNPGHEWGYRAFPEAQIAAVVDLSAAIVRRHDIAPARVLGHSDVAPERKEDPGELFPWTRLAQAGLAAPPFEGAPAPDLAREDCLIWLEEIGYRVDPRGPAAAVLAFQRRHAPASLGRGLDPHTKAAIRAVHAFCAT